MQPWWPLISAVIGGLIASLSSIAVMLIQSRRDYQRQARELALKIAFEERSTQVELAKATGQPIKLYPLDIYVAHSLALMTALEKGKLSPDDIRSLRKDGDAVRSVLDELDPPPSSQGQGDHT